MSNKAQPGEDLDWDAIRAAVLPAWKNTEAGGGMLLFAIPIFGGILFLLAFLLIQETRIPALIVAVAAVLATLYVRAGLNRLRQGKALVLSGRVLEKSTHQSTDSVTRRVSIRHFLTLEVRKAEGLSRSGLVESALGAGEVRKLTTTSEIYGQVREGQDLSVVVMPHDGAVYFTISPETGLVIGGSIAARDGS